EYAALHWGPPVSIGELVFAFATKAKPRAFLEYMLRDCTGRRCRHCMSKQTFDYMGDNADLSHSGCGGTSQIMQSPAGGLRGFHQLSLTAPLAKPGEGTVSIKRFIVGVSGITLVLSAFITSARKTSVSPSMNAGFRAYHCPSRCAERIRMRAKLPK